MNSICVSCGVSLSINDGVTIEKGRICLKCAVKRLDEYDGLHGRVKRLREENTRLAQKADKGVDIDSISSRR
jgi:hypothetical protein